MSARKPLHPDCVGGIFCPVEGHVTGSARGRSWQISHIPLTVGQHKTLRERRKADRPDPKIKESASDED